MRGRMIWAGILGMSLFTLSAYTEVPPLINYQGKLTNSLGAPVPDGNYTVKFCIYADSIGSDSLWCELQWSVQVTDGLFNVLLGSVDPIPDTVFTGPTRWLGIQVSPDPELTPRKPIVSVGYGFKSKLSDTANYSATAGYAFDISDSVVTSMKIQDGQVMNADIADNTVSSAKMEDGTIANVDISESAEIAPTKVSGTAWTSTNDGSGSGLDADMVDGLHAADIALLGQLRDQAYDIEPSVVGMVGLSKTISDITDGTSSTSHQFTSSQTSEDASYVEIDLGSVYTEGYITSIASIDVDGAASPGYYRLKVSHDGTTWTTIKWGMVYPADGEVSVTVEFDYIPRLGNGIRYVRHVIWTMGQPIYLRVYETIVMASD